MGYLVANRKRIPGSYTLLFLLTVNVYALINNYLILSGHIKEVPVVFWGAFIIVGMFPLFLRAHIYTLIGKPVRMDWVNSSIFILWGVSIYFWILFLGWDESTKDNFFDSIVFREFPEGMTVLNALFMLINGGFFIDAGIAVFRRPKNENAIYGNPFVQAVKYARNLWVLNLSVYFLVSFMGVFLEEFLVEYMCIPIGLAVVYFFVVISLKRYTELYSLEQDFQGESESSHNGITITDDRADELLNAINKILDAGAFLDQEFDLSRLASEVSTPKNQVSKVINSQLGVGVRDLINAHRVEYAKKMLLDFDEKTETIEGIGYDSGFNSKASFYRSFKKFTSTTPSEFLLEVKKK